MGFALVFIQIDLFCISTNSRERW